MTVVSCLLTQLMKRKEFVEIRKRLLREIKLIEWSKYSWCSAKESSVLGERIVGAKQKNRRFFLKEATMLRGSSQYTLRNQLTGRQREAINSIHEYLRLSRKSVGIKLEVEGKTSFVLWQKNISKQ